MCNLSSSDGPLFVKFAEEMHAKILEAGPNPIKLALKKKAAVGPASANTARQ
jgi:hypothetical protein